MKAMITYTCKQIFRIMIHQKTSCIANDAVAVLYDVVPIDSLGVYVSLPEAYLCMDVLFEAPPHEVWYELLT